MGPLLGVVGSMQAMEAIKFITSVSENINSSETIFIDLLTNTIEKRKFYKDESCKFCVHHEKEFLVNFEISLPGDTSDYIFLDVRNINEIQTCPFVKNLKNYLHVANINTFEGSLGKKYLVVCAKGQRSFHATSILRQKNIEAYSLKNGIIGLTRNQQDASSF
jgi:rhodanese-related sulfurtransferase